VALPDLRDETGLGRQATHSLENLSPVDLALADLQFLAIDALSVG
jgi:hypothetical protein